MLQAEDASQWEKGFSPQTIPPRNDFWTYLRYICYLILGPLKLTIKIHFHRFVYISLLQKPLSTSAQSLCVLQYIFTLPLRIQSCHLGSSQWACPVFRGLRVFFERDGNDSKLGEIDKLECIHHGKPKTSITIEGSANRACLHCK